MDDAGPFSESEEAEMTRLEALVDAIKSTPPSCASRRDALLELATAMAADARAACFVESLGARELLLKSLEGAIRRGDEALMDAVGAAVAAHSRCDAPAVELMAVGGSQVGAASQRPPGVELVHLRHSGRTVRVHESSWEDAGLAWRIWGASRILAHALDAAAAAERRSQIVATVTDDVPVASSSSASRAVPERGNRAVPTPSSSAHMRVVGRRVLELGAGCGLCGLAAAAVGAREVVLTEGAPGALSALARSAADAVRGNPEAAARVAFLDWRDDQAALDAARTHPDGDRDVPGSNPGGSAPAPERNWVHKLAGGAAAAEALPRLARDETFDLVVGSDLLYDESHAAPLAACLARRLAREDHARAHVVCAVRRGALVASLAVAARRRGLLVGARALAPFEGEDGELRERQGGHITRAEPEGVSEWRESGGETFAEGAGTVVDDEDGTYGDSGTFGEEEAEKLAAAVASLEGRVAMLTMRWPTRRGAGGGAGG